MKLVFVAEMMNTEAQGLIKMLANVTQLDSNLKMSNTRACPLKYRLHHCAAFQIMDEYSLYLLKRI
jgi:hypothetical protein